MFSVLPTPMHNSEGQNVPNSRVQDCSLSMLGQVLWGWLFTLSLFGVWSGHPGQMRCLHWSRSRNVGMSPQSTSITRPQLLDTLQLLIKTMFYKRSAIVDNVDINENLPGDMLLFFIAFWLDNLWSFGYFQHSEAMCLQIFDHKKQCPCVFRATKTSVLSQ